ncbi:acyltransferase [Aquimarina sp. BL5]|uniref:MBOAT family O-acyltransferase n=1 Tax=Aquimarina sp. BL5 TaxID=1714860 RepID=UPI000E4E0ED3|nr:MBOAT family O-acyltransferase [Aquimarina sp. BL5]AXT52903.1 acyltransferase [Aquimarina sp. BL5]RKN02280.1 acyltransferase [Aquimarina sp. BL5]
MISLKDYVKRRNGVPLGHSNSLGNMLKRSLGAKSFDLFWIHCNPIWNYYLNKYIYKPLKRIGHSYAAIVLTFGFSGFVHDLIGLLIYGKLSFLFTIWFMIMGIIVAIFKRNGLAYKVQKEELNYGFNSILILVSFLLAKCVLNGIHFFKT